jgi:hypothetical protein
MSSFSFGQVETKAMELSVTDSRKRPRPTHDDIREETKKRNATIMEKDFEIIRQLEEESKRKYLRQPYHAPNFEHRIWDALPDWVPRMYSARRANWLGALAARIHEFTGIPFGWGDMSSEFEHDRWSHRLDKGFTLESSWFSAYLSRFTHTEGGESDVWYKDKKQCLEKARGFNAPILFGEFIHRDTVAKGIQLFDDVSRKLAPTTMWDVIRDGQNCLAIHVVVAEWELTTSELEYEVAVQKIVGVPPKHFYFLERMSSPTSTQFVLKDTPHLRRLIQDLVVNTPRAASLAKLKGLRFDTAEKAVTIPCLSIPSPDLRLKWLWTDELKTGTKWPIRWSIYHHSPPERDMSVVIQKAFEDIQNGWNSVVKPAGYVNELKFFNHRMPFNDVEDAPFTSLVDQPQEGVDEYAQYMHFPKASRQFHILFEFGAGRTSYDRDAFLSINRPLLPLTPHQAMLVKLEEQGQLLRIGCFEADRNRTDFQLGCYYYRFPTFGSPNAAPDIFSFGVRDAVSLRIMSAQVERVKVNEVLEKTGKLKPHLGLGQVSDLIRSFVGGKYCHNPGCKKECTVACGHCDKAGYCSSECAGKHWPSHH